MSYFRITLVRSAIGLPRRSTDVLKALGLKKRMATVFHSVSPSVAGQIMKVKELVQVEECQYRLTKQEVHLERKPDPGYYTEKSCTEQRGGTRWSVIVVIELRVEWDTFQNGVSSPVLDTQMESESFEMPFTRTDD
ncbi:Ribosomal protein L30 bacterial-type [Penicillium crustosum]|uniref:Ribosomal protein L30 bacterial-type n=1 Tax=Penicillium crustosum TaxID=36656 RepID=UPI0023894809|nr:Ribosomal protein L30 bacterial-type [Penicillium crustosum]KAJ5417552.1 Ribosomal protein L30 bacterial-type [Penicillium crustosum]